MVQKKNDLKKLKIFNFFNELKNRFLIYVSIKKVIFNWSKKLKIFNFFNSWFFCMKWIQGLKTPVQELFSCTGDFHAQARWQRIHWFHGPAHNPYQLDLLHRRIINQIHQVPDEQCKWKRLQEQYCIDWVGHSLSDLFSECECSELPLETVNLEDMNHCKTFQLKLNQNTLLQCYSFWRLIPSLPRAGGHHTPVLEVDQSTSASSRHKSNIHA